MDVTGASSATGSRRTVVGMKAGAVVDMSSGNGARLAYFPEPYPDELLYSMVARYARHMAVPSTHAFRLELFGDKRQSVTHDLPNNVAALARALPSRAGLTPSRLIRRHTLFPYYRAMMPLHLAREVFSGMVGSDRRVRSMARLSERIPVAARLRFCAECDSESVQMNGERYWSRTHQLPGSLACPRHRRVLQASAVEPRKTYQAATEATNAMDAPAMVAEVEPWQMDVMVALAEEGDAILRQGRWAWAHGPAWRERFRSACAAKGFNVGSRAGGGADKGRIALEAAARGSLGFLEPVWPMLFETATPSAWLRRVDRPATHNADPVLRILADQVATRMPALEGHFGPGPWPCLNPLADHFRQETIGTVQTWAIGGGRVGVFACQCGYEYTRLLKRDGTMGRPRLRRYGPTLTALVAESFACGRGVHATSQICQLEIPRLKALAAKQGYRDWPVDGLTSANLIKGGKERRSDPGVDERRRPKSEWTRSRI